VKNTYLNRFVHSFNALSAQLQPTELANEVEIEGATNSNELPSPDVFLYFTLNYLPPSIDLCNVSHVLSASPNYLINDSNNILRIGSIKFLRISL
jgi:hypothetical protein